MSPHWQCKEEQQNATEMEKLSSTNNIIVVSFLSSVLGYVYSKECLNLTDSWEHWLSQEQRFLGNDKVQTLSNGSLCIALQSLAITAANTSRSQAASHPSKHQAPAICGIPGLHNNRGFNSPGLGWVSCWKISGHGTQMEMQQGKAAVRTMWPG